MPSAEGHCRDSAMRRTWGRAMKFFMMAGVLLFAGVGSVSAQGYVGGSSVGAGSGLNGVGTVNGSGSINGGSSATGGVSEPRHTENVQARNPGEFVPSTFENYPAALSLGEAAERMRQPTVAQAARLAQQARAAGVTKPALLLEKNSEGKLIVVETKPIQPK
jgi:hypothetical protein